MSTATLNLTGFSFQELFHASGLQRLDERFLHQLQASNPEAHRSLLAYRGNTHTFPAPELSERLMTWAIFLEDFLIQLFNIDDAAAALQVTIQSDNPIAAFKKFFVLRNAKKQLLKTTDLPTFTELDKWLREQLKKFPLQTDDTELAVALLGNHLLTDTEKHAADIQALTHWCIQALKTPEGQAKTAHWSSFKLPQRIDYQHLVNCTEAHDKLNRLQADPNTFKLRDGFKLTDPRMTSRDVQDEVNYCIYCHDNEGDFCSKGFPVKKGEPELGLKKNPLGLILTGCPLEEKISEMNLLRRDGHTLAALAVIMIDNPMCPATGHRICNDCMKACVYQKQDPVNIPQIETRILTDILSLPWGVEIYDLLTRWNPLRQQQWCMKPYNGQKIMIAGMGPAGFTLAHHLLLEGCAVVGFDGLKIEPLPENFLKQPIHRFEELIETLDERLIAGFGGVAEYGITVRWDKNFLKLIYISLMRKPYFQLFGSVRFGGTIKVEDAWNMGFDHFVVAVGAGLPKALSIPGSLAPGMRQANDFLMALQLGNAAKSSSLTNIQIRLPAVVIGGGLTGVDTATEVQAYYIRQVEKILARYETLTAHYGENEVHKELDPASLEILTEFLTHGKAVRQERDRARAAKQAPNFIKLIHQWGGVTIAYRRTMQESPAYLYNHEELQAALQEGVYYLEAVEPSAALLNAFGHVETLLCHKRIKNTVNEWETTTEEISLPARSIFVATGTQPNIAYEFEHKGTFSRLGLQYQHYEDEHGELTIPHGIEHCKEKNTGPFTSYHRHDKRVSLIGDTHPVFHGNVVKAIASGKLTYPKILAVLTEKLPSQTEDYSEFAARMKHFFHSQVTKITRRAPNVIELTVQAPLAAKHFQPGQFFRLQNYESIAQRIDHTSLQIEPLALTASRVDQQAGTLTFTILETGASSKLCATFRPEDPISLMGPTGLRAKIALEHETVLIIGNQSSLAFLMSYGAALRAKGNRVLFVGYFNSPSEIYCKEKIETITDTAIWCIQQDPLDTLIKHAQKIRLMDVDRIYLISDTELMRRFQAARKTSLKELLPKQPRIFGSVYSTMQCMLKGVCAQCLQWQIDPETGKRTKAVFACSWPEQPLELIDFDNVDERQIQNRLQEKLSALWVDYLLKEYGISRV